MQLTGRPCVPVRERKGRKERLDTKEGHTYNVGKRTVPNRLAQTMSVIHPGVVRSM